jgi:uncharacterized membrane protein
MEIMNTWIKNHLLQLIAVVLVLGALGSFPFAYYQLMNWIVAVAALLVARQAHAERKDPVAWIFVLVAVVFNPVSPIYLRADIWHIADVIAAVLFVASLFLVKAATLEIKRA